MASRTEGSNTKDIVLTDPIQQSRVSGGSSQSSQSSFAGINNPKALDTLMNLIEELSKGGTADYKDQMAQRKQLIASLLADRQAYSKEAAFADAKDLVAQSLQKAMEKNMPAIAKSIEGAGTSASSMQALLSQKLATESSQAAGALGAQQALGYGQISSDLAKTLEQLSKVDTSQLDALLRALELTRIQTSSQQSSESQFSQEYRTGGGTRLAGQGDGLSPSLPLIDFTGFGNSPISSTTSSSSNSSSNMNTTSGPGSITITPRTPARTMGVDEFMSLGTSSGGDSFNPGSQFSDTTNSFYNDLMSMSGDSKYGRSLSSLIQSMDNEGRILF